MRLSSAQLGAGVLLVALGVGMLLDIADVVDFWSHLGTWWPVLLIAAGALVVVDTPRNWLWGLVLAAAGGVFLLSTLEVLAVSAGRLVAPVVVLAIGVSLLVGAVRVGRPVATDGTKTFALFGGNEVRLGAEPFTGGQASAMFGGADLDLRDAVVEDGAVIDVFTFAGGIDLKVPEDVRVVNQVTALLGGVGDKTKTTDPQGPRLYLRGQVLLGGIDVRN